MNISDRASASLGMGTMSTRTGLVAPQTQHRNADQKAHQTGQDAAANHSAQQSQGVAGDIILQHRSDDDAGEGFI